jgi:predicted nucleic acid-binding protein
MKRAASEKVLLDANVLVALAWPNHQFHATATNRLDASGERWATCALTQLGFIQLSTNPHVVGQIVAPRKADSL